MSPSDLNKFLWSTTGINSFDELINRDVFIDVKLRERSSVKECSGAAGEEVFNFARLKSESPVITFDFVADELRAGGAAAAAPASLLADRWVVVRAAPGGGADGGELLRHVRASTTSTMSEFLDLMLRQGWIGDHSHPDLCYS